MKSPRFSLFALLACLAGLDTYAAVVVSDAALIDDPFSSTKKLLTLTQSIPPGKGLFAIEIEARNAIQYTFRYAGIAEEYALFDVSGNEEITSAFANARTPLVSNNGVDPGSASVRFSPNQSRYFGFWDDRNVDNNPDPGDNFGWVLLRQTGSSLSLDSSATAIGSGIIVGTTTQVPEPSSALLLGAGAFILCAIRRTRTKSNRHPTE